MNLQDGEESEEQGEREEDAVDDENQDMFADSQDQSDNPLLAAKTRTVPSRSTVLNLKDESRNPFAKKNVDKNRGLESSPGAGIVFDGTTSIKPKRMLLIPNAKKVKFNNKSSNNYP